MSVYEREAFEDFGKVIDDLMRSIEANYTLTFAEFYEMLERYFAGG